MNTLEHLKNSTVRERFIPVYKQELVEDLVALHAEAGGDEKHFALFCEMLTAIYHYRYHQNLEVLKFNYLPFSADTDTPLQRAATSRSTRVKCLNVFSDNLTQLMADANYDHLDVASIHEILENSSPPGVQVTVDMEDFDEIGLYYRNSYPEISYKRDWRWLWLRKRKHSVDKFSRLLFVFKMKPAEQLVPPEGRFKRWLWRRGLRNRINHDFMYLKLFKEIPVSDVQMLFPNCKVRMRMFDKIKIGVTGGTGTVGGAIATAGKLGAATSTVGIFVAIGGFIAILLRQVMNIFHRRNHYMMTLAQHLYHHALASNAGVLARLVDQAEEEEVKEAVLAYHFLATHPAGHFTEASLDKHIEDFIEERYQLKIDFEVDDALDKLANDGMLFIADDGTLSVAPADQVCAKLDDYWDNLYSIDADPCWKAPCEA